MRVDFDPIQRKTHTGFDPKGKPTDVGTDGLPSPCEVHQPMDRLTGRVLPGNRPRAVLKIGPYSGRGTDCLVSDPSVTRWMSAVAAARTGETPTGRKMVDAFPGHIRLRSSRAEQLSCRVWDGKGELLGVFDIDQQPTAI